MVRILTSGRPELVNEGETALESLQEHIESNKDHSRDDDWIRGSLSHLTQ